VAVVSWEKLLTMVLFVNPAFRALVRWLFLVMRGGI